MGAVSSVVDAVGDLGQGAIDVVSDAGSALDDFVREEIPGGWAIPVAVATAGALSGGESLVGGAGAGVEAGLAEGAFPGATAGTVASDVGIAALAPAPVAGATTGLGSGIADLGLPTGTEMVTQGGLAPAPTVGQGATLAAPTATPAGFTVGAPVGLTALEAGLEGAQLGAQRGAIAGGIKSAVTGEDPLEGALRGAGIGALTGGVGGAAGNVATGLGAGATGSAAASGAAMGATGAALTGGDPLTGLIAGGVGGGIGNLTQGALAGSGLDKTVVAPIAQTAGQLAASVATGRTDNLEDLLLSGGLSAGTGYVTSQIPGFSDMSDAAKNAANGVIKSLITTGTINEAALVNAGIQAANTASAKEWSTPEARDTAVAAAQTEEDNLARLFGFKDAAERELANSYGITSGTRWALFNQQQETPTVAPPSTELAQESAAGLDQLVNAITNPDSTASYTGTNVADVSGGITGLPADQPTEQDYEQLGVGLPTLPEEPFGGIEALTPELNVGTAAPPVSAGIDALIPQVTEFVPTYTEAPVGYQETPLPGNGYQQTVPETTTTGIEALLPPAIEPTPEPVPTYTEAPVGYQEEPTGIELLLPQVPEPMPEPVAVDDGTTSGIEDLISQITPPVFEGIDMTGGQTDTYQASNEEEPNVPTLPDNTQVAPQVVPEVPAPPSIPQVADDGTTAGIQDVINQLPGGTGMDETDIYGQGEGAFPGINTGSVASDQGNEIYAGFGEGAFPGTQPGTVATDQPAGNTGLTPTMLEQLSKATGLSPTTLAWLGTGLGVTGLSSLLGPKAPAGAAQVPYTGSLLNYSFNPSTYTPYTYKPYAAGGVATGGIATLGGYSDGGRLLKGPGDGVSDSIPAMIGNKQPARLADGEFVIPARIVSEIGNGSTDAGARKLYEMMDRVQSARRKTMGKNKFAANTKADKYLPT